MKATVIDELPISSLGEGPWWDTQEQKLYWVDIMGQQLHSYVPATNCHSHYRAGELMGFALPRQDGKIIAGLRDGIYELTPTSHQKKYLTSPKNMPTHNRFNDGKCDRGGRLWCGTMNVNPANPEPTGSLYRYDIRGLVEMESKVFISNGLGWNANSTLMYYTDTVRREIWQYDYNLGAGTFANKRVLAKVPEADGRPDGLTVDSQGRILCAMWPGWRVNIYTPDGKLDDVIELPVPQVSSCIFGGPRLKTLYITTASVGLSEQQMIEAPLSGCVFAIDLDVPGLPEIRFEPTV